MHINTFTNNSLEAILSNALKDSSSAATSSTSTNSLNSSATSSTSSSSTTSDNSQLSLFAQLISMLQELQQSNSTQYQSVTQKIAANLRAAAQTAQADGNTSEASQLTQVATQFANASTTGQLPDVQDLFQSLNGSNTPSKTGLSQLEQLLASIQPSSQNQNNTPMSIILNTLSSLVKNG